MSRVIITIWLFLVLKGTECSIYDSNDALEIRISTGHELLKALSSLPASGDVVLLLEQPLINVSSAPVVAWQNGNGLPRTNGQLRVKSATNGVVVVDAGFRSSVSVSSDVSACI